MLASAPPQLLEATDLSKRPRLVGERQVRTSPPLLERGLGERDGARRIAVSAGRARSRHHALEAGGVDLLGVGDHEPIAAGGRLDDSVAKCAPEAGHVGPQRVERPVGSLAIEEHFEQPVVADAVIRVHEEHAEEAVLDGPSDNEGTVCVLRLDPTQHGEVHADHPLGRTSRGYDSEVTSGSQDSGRAARCDRSATPVARL